MKRQRPEDRECEHFASWLELKKLKFSHIANESVLGALNQKAALIIGSKLKRMGQRKGVPDYVVLTPKGTVWVELKDPAKKLKKGDVMEGWEGGQDTRGGLKREQYDWINAINKTPGAQAKVCYGHKEAEEFVSHFLI